MSKNKSIVGKKSQEILAKTNKIRMQKMQQKQTRILKVATKLFLKNGYQKTNIQMVGRQTSSSFATIYNIFGNKKNLFYKVVEFNGEIFVESLNKIFVQNIDCNLELEKYFYLIGLCLINEMLSAQNIALMRLIIIEGYDNPEIVTIFNRISDVINSYFINGIEYYKNETNLHINKKEIEECAKILIHLIVEPYWLHPLMDSNYTPPPNNEIEYALKRAIKIFMLYLKNY